MTVSTVLSDVAQKRASAAAAGHRPSGDSRLQPFDAQLRAETVDVDGQQRVRLLGHASTTGRFYEMWDMFGPYEEEVSAGAFEKTLAATPDVSFLVNHRGITMARTTNGTLELAEDEIGLQTTAFLNPKRQDVTDLVHAIEDRDITEMSFAFRIVDGSWNDDYTRYTIGQVDLDRGDVSAVTYGANPYTSVAARSGQIIRDLEKMPTGAARAAVERLQAREDLIPEPSGRSVAMLIAQEAVAVG